MDGPLHLTWRHLLVAAVIAAGAFFLPQEGPLEWYPLDNPRPGSLQIEITCMSTTDSGMQIFYDNGPRWHVIDVNLMKTDAPYTYVLPLPDAPLTGLRLDPFFTGPGEFTVARLRLIERGGKEVMSFPIESVKPNPWVKSVDRVGDGWKITAAPKSEDPYVVLTLPHSVTPSGMNLRNMERCLHSIAYLAGMLWLILLTALSIVRRGEGFRAMFRPAVTLALLALMFAIVGNRGLVRASLEDAWLSTRLAKTTKA